MQNLKSISKLLSPNDVGLTGTHQSGMLVPKKNEILTFFPTLITDTKNPRKTIDFLDENGRNWKFSFIFYNNIFYGGTRNEYRLTRMTKFISTNNLNVGDEIILTRNNLNEYRISIKKLTKNSDGKLTLSTTWKVINIKH